jgi:hypothetical protein
MMLQLRPLHAYTTNCQQQILELSSQQQQKMEEHKYAVYLIKFNSDTQQPDKKKCIKNLMQDGNKNTTVRGTSPEILSI